MRYLLMICFDGSVAANPPPDLTLGSPLRPVSDATSVRVREGRVLLGDSPCAQSMWGIVTADVEAAWREIATLYERLERLVPSGVVSLLPATRADLPARLARPIEAADSHRAETTG